jgi:hypothetical protein
MRNVIHKILYNNKKNNMVYYASFENALSINESMLSSSHLINIYKPTETDLVKFIKGHLK